MIVHTVLLRLARPIDDERMSAFLDEVRAFAADPPHALAPAELILDAGLRPEGRSVSEAMLRGRFADEHAFQRYLEDPRHVALVEQVFTPNLGSWLSLQYQE